MNLLCRGEVFAVLARLVMFSLYFRCIRCFIVSRLIWFVCPWRMSSTTCVPFISSARRGVTNQSTHSKQRGGGYRREPQAESGVRRAGLDCHLSCRDNFCLIFQCNDCLALRTVLCFTPKQQSLHSKQKSPPTTHQLGEPPALFLACTFSLPIKFYNSWVNIVDEKTKVSMKPADLKATSTR